MRAECKNCGVSIFFDDFMGVWFHNDPTAINGEREECLPRLVATPKDTA